MCFKVFSDGIYVVESSIEPQINEIVYLVNPNCEFSYDSFFGCFSNSNELKSYKIDVDILYEQIDDYIPAKSNNGGHYAFAGAKVKAVQVLE